MLFTSENHAVKPDIISNDSLPNSTAAKRSNPK